MFQQPTQTPSSVRPSVHCVLRQRDLPATAATPVPKAFTTDVGQMPICRRFWRLSTVCTGLNFRCIFIVPSLVQ